MLFSLRPSTASCPRPSSLPSLLHPIPLLLLGGLLLVAGCDSSVDLQQDDADPTARTVPDDSSGLALAPMPTGSELLTPGEPAPKSNADASAYGCYLASRPYSDEVAFHSRYLHFPEEVIEDAGGQTRAVARYMAVSRPGLREEVGVRYATCVIPDTDEAEGVLEEQLLYPGLENANQQALQDQGLIPKSTCTQIKYLVTCRGPSYDPIRNCTVEGVEEIPVPCGGGSPPTGGDRFPDDPGGPGGSDGDEPGGGDNNTDCTEINPPPGSDCEPVAPCESDAPPEYCDDEEDDITPCSEVEFDNATHAEVMETLDELGILEELWEASNPDAADQSERREQGGWIVEEDGSYEFVPYDELSDDVEYLPSGILNTSNAPPSGAIATIHMPIQS
ncbi:hypothetical protein [Longimonas halophila]|uniref:hypothetical protein n=1 Tax=Longimonas halophila TaxID=1469170 RepID=UPI0011448056|nr:hypothetical protein [Longimonas halophila]